MKKTNTILFIFLIVLSAFSAQAQPGWTVNPRDYDYNMTVTGIVKLDYVEAIDTEDMVGAFNELGECIGVKKLIYNSSRDRYFAYLMIYNNNISATITFKVYDASADQIRDISTSLEFSPDASIGSVSEPYMFADPVLSDDTSLSSFAISGQENVNVTQDSIITISMPYGVDFTSLIASFTTNNAYVEVEGTEQIPGVSSNNYSDTLIYTVTSSDETQQYTYYVVLRYSNVVPTNISLSLFEIAETSNLEYEIGILTSEDLNTEDLHTYTLIAGIGDTDNASFLISENKLLLNTLLDYETKTVYSVRIQTNDENGGLFEKEFTITVIDENDETPQMNPETIILAENQTLKIVHTIVSTDADIAVEFKNIEFSISSGNEEEKFSINSFTGEILLIETLDFETTKVYQLGITASDGLNEKTVPLIVYISDLNDEIPVFADTEIEVRETTEIGDLLEQLKATDADANSDLTFSILGNDDGTFTLEADGKLLLKTFLDFETQSDYFLTIEVSDGLNIGVGTLTVKVLDYNKNVFTANNTFTPNNDGFNDFWEVEEVHLYYECKFLIFNSIGEIVYQSVGYNNDWDGTYKGKQVPVGTYYYIIKCPDCADCNSNGSISIIR